MTTLTNYLEYGSSMNQIFEDPIKKCRICLSETIEHDMNLIFEPKHDGFSIADILESISNIKVEKDSQMPNLVCKECSKIIFDFRYLVKTFCDSEEYLKNCLLKDGEFILEKQNIKEDEFLGESDNFNSDSLLFNNEGSGIDSDNEASPYPEDGIAESDDIQIPSNVTTNDNRNSGKETNEINIEIEDIQRENPNKIETKVLESQSETEEIPSTKYTCKICGDCFLFKSGFGHHMLMNHNVCIQVNQYEEYSSQITIKVPKGLPDMENKYVRKCNPPIPLYKTEVQCKKCKEIFATIEALKEHNEVHKTFRCEQCGAAFIKNSYLRDHLLKHSADKCYSCKDCGQAFKYRSALAVHRREHIGTNTGHMCETCGRNFKERGTLKTHIMLKHTNERNFPCSGCDLTFKLKAARDKHYMRKHTSNRTKDFVCSMCGMAYLNKETLTRHMTDKHSGTRSSHWCTVCHKSFTMKSNLSKHLRNKHNVIIKAEQF